MKVVTVSSACRSRKDLIESTTPCRNVQIVGLCPGLNPVCPALLVTKSEGYITTPRQLLNQVFGVGGVVGRNKKH